MLTLPLHPYQEPAVDAFLERGALMIAYEMGLGKTPIAIACAEELLGCGDIETCLLVVPASLKYQWAQALVKFTDLPPDGYVMVDGIPSKRKKQLKNAIVSKPDYVIMSYETVVSDTRLVKRIKAGMVVLDEASAIKNFGAERTRTIKRALMSEYRLALTGTPVENKPEEAFSIMEWVDPDVLGSFDLFEKAYIDRWPNGTVKKYKNTHLLNRKLSDAMVRRSRKDPAVAKYLPAVDHDQWYVDLDTKTRESYDILASNLLNMLLAIRGSGTWDMAAYYAGQKVSENTGMGKVMARQQAIELLLDHPQLIRTSARKYAADEGQGSKYCAEVSIIPEVMHATTPKLDYLVRRVEKILEFPENKILIFSQYPEMQDFISERLSVPCVRYHGGMTAKAKARAVSEFTESSGPRVFLSSHAGAYGTDMHMANYLINYDLPWSGGTWGQINGRHQRVSSEFGQVFIRDLIVRGTTEERKLSVVKHKLKIAEAIVDGRAPRSGRIENDLDSLTEFLQSR